jgi:hypothetical protein
MTTILKDLPYFDARSVAAVRNRDVPIKSRQIVVWVSLAETEARAVMPGTPRFPAVLDTGFSHNFGIREEYLVPWAGIQPAYLRRIADVRVNKVPASLHEADVWLHRNRPGKRDETKDDRPFCLELNQGIVVYPAGSPDAPRLPILGLHGLEWTGLRLSIDSARRRVGLRTPRRFGFF